MPGVLEIEMIAQTAAACVRVLRPNIYVVLSSIQSARFLKPVSPGDQCRITATIVKMQPHRVQVTGYVEVAGIRVEEAESVAAIVPGAGFDTRDTVVENWMRRQEARGEKDSVEKSEIAFVR